MNPATTRLWAALLVVSLLGAGCMFREVRRQQERSAKTLRLYGEVSTAEPGPGLLVVLLIQQDEAGGRHVVDHYVREQAGRFYFAFMEPGTYSVAAFQDLNGDLNYDPDEPARPQDEASTFRIGVGETVEGVDLVIQPDVRAPVDGPVDIRALQARSLAEQLTMTVGQLSALGEVAVLSDPRFGEEAGKKGMWKPFDFVFDYGPGVYFLEEYDPGRVPVLFVHGMLGYPQEFTELIESLDRRRFQPWFYFYPSGGRLAPIAAHLKQLVVQLRAEHEFERVFVVAHSVGGLVAREFALQHHEGTGHHTVQLLVTLCTPWGGDPNAQKGVERAPAVVESWRDVSPSGRFLRHLFLREPELAKPRRLPDHLAYHLLFGFDRGSGRGPSSDGVISLESQLRPEAQAEARSLRGFDASHQGILRDRNAINRVNHLLRQAL